MCLHAIAVDGLQLYGIWIPNLRLWRINSQTLSKKLKEYPAGGKEVSIQLLELRQGCDTAANFAIKFCMLAAQYGWNEMALVVVFREGLNHELKADMVCRDTNVTLSQYISTAIRLDNLRCQHRFSASTPRSLPCCSMEYYSPREEAAKPMQLGRSCVSEGERECRVQLQLCFYCGQPGHRVFQCPKRLPPLR